MSPHPRVSSKYSLSTHSIRWLFGGTELSPPLCPLYRVEVMPQGAVKGSCIELGVEGGQSEEVLRGQVREDVEQDLGRQGDKAGSGVLSLTGGTL